MRTRRSSPTSSVANHVLFRDRRHGSRHRLLLADSRPRRVERESEDEPDPERDRRNHDGQVVHDTTDPDVVGPAPHMAGEASPSPGSPAASTQPPRIRAGRKASRKTFPDTLGQPHFVQPPSSWESAIVKPAAAMSAESRPVLASRVRAETMRAEPQEKSCDQDADQGCRSSCQTVHGHHLHPGLARFASF